MKGKTASYFVITLSIFVIVICLIASNSLNEIRNSDPVYENKKSVTSIGKDTVIQKNESTDTEMTFTKTAVSPTTFASRIIGQLCYGND